MRIRKIKANTEHDSLLNVYRTICMFITVPQRTLIKNEFDQTNDINQDTYTHLGTQKQLTVKSKNFGFR